MRGPLRLVAIAIASATLAALLPVYAIRNETRSFMVGSGGDIISHDWSLHTLPGALHHLRHDSSPTLPRLALIALFLALTTTLTLIAHRRGNRLTPR
jgi:hypothetical protein